MFCVIIIDKLALEKELVECWKMVVNLIRKVVFVGTLVISFPSDVPRQNNILNNTIVKSTARTKLVMILFPKSRSQSKNNNIFKKFQEQRSIGVPFHFDEANRKINSHTTIAKFSNRGCTLFYKKSLNIVLFTSGPCGPLSLLQLSVKNWHLTKYTHNFKNILYVFLGF